MKRAALALAAWLCLLTPVPAHEIRPAYLELRETTPGTFEVLFKTPRRGDQRLDLRVVLSGRNETTPVVSRRTADARIETWRVHTLDPLRGQDVRIDGLESTMTDALVRIVYTDGDSFEHLLTPAAPLVTVPAHPGGASVAAASVTLWAAVNAVTALISSRVLAAISVSARTNSRWSMPVRMWLMPSRTYPSMSA